MNELLQELVEVNLALGAAVALVMAAGGRIRRCLGAQAAYAFWWAPAAAAAAVLVPRPGGAPRSSAVESAPWLAPGVVEGAVVLWLAGAAIAFALMVRSHLLFERLARAGRAGPALVGLITPRVVMPADSRTRWSAEELALVRAHERAHLDRDDAKVNALAALLQCVCWFNPLVHMGAARLRFDQELACDAAVMTLRPGRRRAYAEAMLKAQAPSPAAPLGCAWGAGGGWALETRITALGLSGSRRSGEFADAGVSAFILAVVGAAWMLQPAQSPAPKPEIDRALMINIKPSPSL